MSEPTGEIITTPQKPFIERKNGVARIVKPEGIFDILYGIHEGKTQNQNQIDKSINGLILEDASRTPISTDSEMLKRFSSWIRENKQYYSVVKRAEKLNIPIYFVDSGLTVKADSVDFLSRLQFGLGIYSLQELAQQLQHLQFNALRPEEVARIGFLTLVGLWTTGPLLTQVVGVGSHLTGVGKDTSAKLVRVAKETNPSYDYFTLNLRNRLIAHKIQWLMQHMQEINPSFNHLAVVMGGGHAGIEKLLLEDFAELEKHNVDSKSLLNFGLQRETIPTIAEFRFDEETNSWIRKTLLMVPELNVVDQV